MGKKELRAAMNKINKQFGANTVMIVGEHQEELAVKFYPTPSNDTNEMLCGGIGVGKVIELAGENSSGKTSLALEIIAYNQKLAREKAIAEGKAPDDYDFACGFFETEQSWDPEYAKSLGVDLDQCIYWDQKEHGAEKGLDILISLVRSGEFKIIVVNSVAGLSPIKEREGDMVDANMALTARMMSKLMRVIIGDCDKHKCTLIFINQFRATMAASKYAPAEDTSGGRALKFYASQRIFMNKVKVQAEDPITEEEGIKVNCIVKKNRLATGKNPYRRCTYYAKYGEGIDNMATMPLLLTRIGIIRSAGAWMYYENENGELLTIGDRPAKWNGKNALLDDLKNDKLVFDTLQNALNVKLGLSEGISVDPDVKEELEKEEADSQLSED